MEQCTAKYTKNIWNRDKRLLKNDQDYNEPMGTVFFGITGIKRGGMGTHPDSHPSW